MCENCKDNVDSFFRYVQNVKEVDTCLRAAALKTNSRSNISVISDKKLFSEHTQIQKQKQFSCPECKRAYTRFKTFQLHKRSHSTLFCTACETDFDYSLQKSQHMCNSSISSSVNNFNEDEVFSDDVEAIAKQNPSQLVDVNERVPTPTSSNLTELLDGKLYYIQDVQKHQKNSSATIY